jgi:predicted transposase YdaD
MAKLWDDLMKILVRANPQSFVSFLLPGAQFLGERDKELQTRTVHADLLYNVIWHGREIILHVEFQRKRDEQMALRVWEYNVLTRFLTRRPVYSIVIYLVKQKNVVEPPYTEEVAGEVIHQFSFRNIKLWEITPAMIKQVGLEGLLPLLPLTQGGKRREVVEETIAELRARQRRDLLPLSYAFAALVFTKKADKQWLKERFEKMQEILEESWAYQEMVQKGWLQGHEKGLDEGRQEGRQEGLQEGRQKGLQEGRQEGRQEGQLRELFLILARLVRKRFPTLAPLVAQQSLVTKDADMLRNTIDAILDAQTVDEASNALNAALQSQ